MTLINVISYLVVWGIIGAVLFSSFVIFVFRTGIVYTARNKDGLIKERIPITEYLTSIGFLVIIIFFLVAANYFGLIQNGYQLSFWSLYALNLGFT